MKRLIILIVFIVLLIGIGVFWFIFIRVPKGEEFDIKFTNLQKIAVNGGTTEEKIELKDNCFSTRTSFVKKGDSVEYTFDAINDGTINAKLFLDPIYLKADMYFKKHIAYSITYQNGDKVQKGDELKVGETKVFKVRLSYENNADIATVDSQFFESKVCLLYLQNR